MCRYSFDPSRAPTAPVGLACQANCNACHVRSPRWAVTRDRCSSARQVERGCMNLEQDSICLAMIPKTKLILQTAQFHVSTKGTTADHHPGERHWAYPNPALSPAVHTTPGLQNGRHGHFGRWSASSETLTPLLAFHHGYLALVHARDMPGMVGQVGQTAKGTSP